MTRYRVSVPCFVMIGALLLAPVLAPAQYSPSGLSTAQLKQLHALNVPIVVPVPAPKGFRVTRVVPNAYDKSYKVVYQSQAGATIVFEATDIYNSAAQVAAGASAAPVAPTAAPKRGIFQRIFANPVSASQAPGAASNANRSGTSSEAEGQGATTAQIVADSALIGPIRFTPVGACLQGMSEAAKGQIRTLRMTVSGCNFDNPDVLISAYKSLQRV